jgi:hypothetical protein
MKKNSLLTNLSFLFLAAVITMAHANKVHDKASMSMNDWRLLGSVSAGHNGDHDVIHVDGPHDTYRRLKFRVTRSPLNMHRMVVTYDDKGAPENIEVRNEIPKDGESRVIDLKGGKRKLRSVEFWFDTKGILNGKAEVTLYGQK